MTAHAGKGFKLKSHVPGPIPLDGDHTVGEEAVHFTRWFMKSKYHLMGSFYGELTAPRGERDVAALKLRFARALHHAHRVHQARAFVTFLLALGVIAAASSSIARVLALDFPTSWLDRAVAISTSATVVLVALRLGLDRYLERCDVAATFLAIELSAFARVATPASVQA